MKSFTTTQTSKDYIDGKKELRDINMEFRRGFVSGEEGISSDMRPGGNEKRISVIAKKLGGQR